MKVNSKLARLAQVVKLVLKLCLNIMTIINKIQSISKKAQKN